jgi:hypothetical protein
MNNNISKDSVFPPISEELLRALAMVYPERCAKLGETVQEIYFHAGQRAVFLHLQRIYNDQNEESLLD